MKTITIEIPEEFAIGNKVAGEWLPVDPSKMSNSWALEIFRYGFRKINDNCKGDLPSERLALAREMVKEINAGEEFVGRSRGGSSTMTPEAKMALSLAKDELKRRFKALTGMARIADMCAANEKVAEYFDDTTWKDAKVLEWVAAQKESGKADYIKLAQEQIAAQKALAESVDISDI